MSFVGASRGNFLFSSFQVQDSRTLENAPGFHVFLGGREGGKYDKVSLLFFYKQVVFLLKVR